MEKEKKNMPKMIISIITLIILVAILVILCVGYAKKATTKIQNPIATMEVEGYGTIKIELYPKIVATVKVHLIK